MKRNLLLVALLLATGVVPAEEVPEVEHAAAPAEAQGQEDAIGGELVARSDQPQVPTDKGAKLISGMSILGNQEAPKSLVIVPWKSSEIGDTIGISTMLDDSRQPVDRDVFLRSLSYYQIRSESTP